MNNENEYENYYKYWAKNTINTDCGDNRGDFVFHLLPYHCLDAAAVAKIYFAAYPSLGDFLAKRLGLEKNVLEKISLFFVAIHDVGKFSESFQNLRPELLLKLQNKDSTKDYKHKHDVLGYALWEKILKKCLQQHGFFQEALQDNIGGNGYHNGLEALARAAIAHHGQPTKEQRINLDDWFFNSDYQACFAFVDQVRKIFLEDVSSCILQQIDEAEFEKNGKYISWWFAGVTVLADWLASNNKYFVYLDKAMPLTDYWLLAQEKAQKIISGLKFDCAPQINEELDFTKLFGKLKPTPLQQAALELQLANEPQLFILEDVTGAGKTEAALILAKRLFEQNSVRGFYFALPTMATSNAMYGRIKNYSEKLLYNIRDISLILAHGKSDFYEDFQKTITNVFFGCEDNLEDKELSSEASCKAWFTDSSKKALLAHIGVGTIDQALQMILPNKHQSLRLLGMFGKVLIVDEVHACDSYMNKLLQTVLTFHAASGGSAILLSATLPQKTREELINAFYAGISWRSDKNNKLRVQKNDYPLLTHVTTAGLTEQHIAAREVSKRSVKVTLIDNQAEIINAINNALQRGECVCWLRNTITDALESYEALQSALCTAEIILFHSQFTISDRNRIEKKILQYFGENAPQAIRCGKLVIATQVIEQSLDIDFDFMVSDLAPIDLLIQRAGRLQRHQRKECRRPPEFLVYGPKPIDDAKDNWYKSFFAKASYVYEHHGQLWLTAKLLQERGQITLPEDARFLIEGVYGSDAVESIPKNLESRSNQADGKQSGNKSQAALSALKLQDGYVRQSAIDWWDEGFTPTRLGDTTIILRLAKWQNNTLFPWCKNDDDWTLSQLSVNAKKIKQRKISGNSKLEKAIAEVEQSLPDKGKWSILLPLEFDTAANIWKTRAEDSNTKSVMIKYSEITGLVIED